MQKLSVSLGFFALFFLVVVPKVQAQTINWMTWEEAIKANDKEPKKLFVDVYTQWCGWCKKMDKTTFLDPKIVDYVNANFYAVKLDAEQRADIKYKGQTLKYYPDAGRRGIHELAYALLDGKMSYPSYIFLDEKQSRITVAPGYQAANDFINVLKYIGGGAYSNKTFDEFMATGE